jgi:2-polyprenyl-3-methyl-5-hydroxy-6-metoxy-1,4-benzoquinol methylase
MSSLATGLVKAIFGALRVIKPVRERVTLGEFNDHVEREHVARYKFASQYCHGQAVADMACGTGYGSQLLRSVAASVDSYDKDLLCNNHVIDLDRESWTKHYDVIVSFETIEHLDNPEFFLNNVHATCKRLIVSTPIGELPGYNPHHKQVWTLPEFKALLDRWFTCEYFAQENEEITAAPGVKCRFVVAVCVPKQR